MVDDSVEQKRILALSGGGVRGIVEVAFLEAVENALKDLFGPNTGLCDVFHLIGGTSTGALIAVAVSRGISLADIREFYVSRATEFFRNRRWLSALGQVPAFDGAKLEQEFRDVIGDIALDDPGFLSHCAIVTKRLDTGSPWILSTLDKAPYFNSSDDSEHIGNRHFKVSRLLRAATAAPTYFDQSTFEIGGGVTGTFVDGGLSPHNDPSLALLKLARLKAYGLNWPTGADRLFVLSLGSGYFRARLNARTARRLGPLPLAYYALRGMTNDAEMHTVALMQWLGTSPRPVKINSEIGDLAEDMLTPDPVFTYLRFDLPLIRGELAKYGIDVPQRQLRQYQRIDDASIIAPIYDLTHAYIDSALDIKTLLSNCLRNT